MKTTIRTMVMAIVLTLGLNMNAAEGFAVTVKENNTLTVALNNITTGSQIMLEDINGEVLYNVSLEVPSFTKSLSFEILPKGKYYLLLENEYSIIKKVVVKSANGIEILEKEGDMIFKPAYKVDGDLVMLSLTNPNEQKIEVKVYDIAGETVGTVVDSHLVVKQTLDFSKIKAGEYVISVKVGEDTFTKSVNIS